MSNAIRIWSDRTLMVILAGWFAICAVRMGNRTARDVWGGRVPLSVNAIRDATEGAFPFKGNARRMYDGLRLRLFSALPSTVVRGADGWLFYRGEIAADGHSFDLFTGDWRLSNADVAAWRATLEERRRRLAGMGIRYVVIIVPSKESIYGRSALADTQFAPASSTATDQVATLLAEAGIPCLDLRPPLITASGAGRLYYQGDTHWTPLGAVIVGREILGFLRGSGPSAASPPQRAPSGISHRGDIAAMAGLAVDEATEDYLIGSGEESLAKATARLSAGHTGGAITTRTSDTGEGTCLVFHDSFGACLMPALVPVFHRSTWCWSNGRFQWADVERERPGLVIQVLVERYLEHLIPAPVR